MTNLNTQQVNTLKDSARAKFLKFCENHSITEIFQQAISMPLSSTTELTFYEATNLADNIIKSRKLATPNNLSI